MKLEKYLKNKITEQKELATTTSILILEKHHDFIKNKNLNLSHLIRDFIENLIKESNKAS